MSLFDKLRDAQNSVASQSSSSRDLLFRGGRAETAARDARDASLNADINRNVDAISDPFERQKARLRQRASQLRKGGQDREAWEIDRRIREMEQNRDQRQQFSDENEARAGELRGLARDSLDVTVANQRAGASSRLNQALQRMGMAPAGELSGFAAGGLEAMESELSGIVVKGMMDFETDMGKAIFAAEQGLFSDQMNFGREMIKMFQNNELAKNFASHQAALKADQSKLDAAMGALGDIAGAAVPGVFNSFGEGGPSVEDGVNTLNNMNPFGV